MIQRFVYRSRQYQFFFGDGQDHIARTMQSGFYEQPMLEAIRDLNLEGTYIDAGAHVGNHTVFFANECPSTKVIAFEPSPDTFSVLQRNVSQNSFRSQSAIELHNCAVGEAGQRVQVVRRNDENTGMDQCRLDETGQEVRTIDDTLEGLTEPLVVLKLDLEGFEEHALRGAVRSIRKFRPLLVIEAAEPSALAAQESALAPLGYQCGKRWNSTPTYFWTPTTDICVVIMTFNRPNELWQLLEDIEREKGERNVLVLVYDDCSTADYLRVRTAIDQRGWIYVRTAKNLGKSNFWKLFNLVFTRLKAISFKRVIFLQDDMRLCASFFDRALKTWTEIADPRKIALNLHIDRGRESLKNGTKSRGPLLAGGAELSGWIDCVFLAERKLLRTLGYGVDPISTSRWRRRERLGSGVGEQLSRRLHAGRWRMYRVRESMVYHSLVASQLNPVERVHNRCSTVRFVDGSNRARRLVANDPLIASMAAIPSRVRLLKATVESLLDQVDELNVYLNGFANVPACLNGDKIHVASSERFGDRGDAGKFWWALQTRGYHFTVDDDIVYPPDYCEVLVRKIEEFGREAVVGVHGVVLMSPFRNYYDSRKVYHFEASLDEDRFVHILGTGTLAYHRSSIKIDVTDFPMKNMADIFFGVLAQRQQIPLVAVARGKNWLVSQNQIGPTIYSEAKQRGGSLETELIESVGVWRLPEHGRISR